MKAWILEIKDQTESAHRRQLSSQQSSYEGMQQCQNTSHFQMPLAGLHLQPDRHSSSSSVGGCPPPLACVEGQHQQPGDFLEPGGEAAGTSFERNLGLQEVRGGSLPSVSNSSGTSGSQFLETVWGTNTVPLSKVHASITNSTHKSTAARAIIRIQVISCCKINAIKAESEFLCRFQDPQLQQSSGKRHF